MEIRDALENWKDAKKEEGKQLAEQKRMASGLWGAAKASQIGLAQQLQADADAERAKEAEEAAAEAARASVAAEAERRKQEAMLALEQQKEAKKAAWNARVDARRASRATDE